jgi:hypothetical protein
MIIHATDAVEVSRKFAKPTRAGAECLVRLRTVVSNRNVACRCGQCRVVVHDIDHIEQVVIRRTRRVIGIGRVHPIEFVQLKLGLIEQSLDMDCRQRLLLLSRKRLSLWRHAGLLVRLDGSKSGRTVDDIGQARHERLHVGVEFREVRRIQAAG